MEQPGSLRPALLVFLGLSDLAMPVLRQDGTHPPSGYSRSTAAWPLDGG